MAVFKIFPEKDTTIYSSYPEKNAGMDSILELNNDYYYRGDNGLNPSRILMKFNTDEIKQITNNIINSSSVEFYLNLYTAYNKSIPENYSIIANPIYQYWEQGVEFFMDNNYGRSKGSNWINKTDLVSWSLSGLPLNVTSSYNNIPGGGNWYKNIECSQSFNINDVKDISMNVTPIIDSFINNTISNEGIILRVGNNYEFNSGYKYSFRFFSKDSHTVYPPSLEIKWDDSVYQSGSKTPISYDSDPVLSISNNLGIFSSEDKYRFIITGRDRFPERRFVTQSVYNETKILPEASYWSLRDSNTKEYIINFDDNFTKISCNGIYNYFDVYMKGLQPNRYYDIIIKVKYNNGAIKEYDGFKFHVK